MENIWGGERGDVLLGDMMTVHNHFVFAGIVQGKLANSWGIEILVCCIWVFPCANTFLCKSFVFNCLVP